MENFSSQLHCVTYGSCKHYNCDCEPSRVENLPWIYCVSHEIEQKYAQRSNGTAQYSDIGKWMLFVDKKCIDSVWEKLKILFRKDSFQGVIQIKCSSNASNPRAIPSPKGAIMLYCFDSYNEEHIMRIGRNILREVKLPDRFIYYKTDQQTLRGTIATGQKKNHLYRLSCQNKESI